MYMGWCMFVSGKHLYRYISVVKNFYHASIYTLAHHPVTIRIQVLFFNEYLLFILLGANF